MKYFIAIRKSLHENLFFRSSLEGGNLAFKRPSQFKPRDPHLRGDENGVRINFVSCKWRLTFIAIVFLSGCATTPPSNPNNICDIFEDKSDWYKAAKKSQDKWGSTIPVMMSIMYQESQFVQNARPARTKFLWIFPGPRPSNAYGFAQVKSDTWNDYQREEGGIFASRSNFKDAVDFIGWYNAQSQERNKIKQNDVYNLYLAYHEGQGGYAKKTFNSKVWLKSTAQKVATRAAEYSKQLPACEDKLQSGHWWWPF